MLDHCATTNKNNNKNNNNSTKQPDDEMNVQLLAPPNAAASELLTPDAVRFVAYLCDKFEVRRQALLAERKVRAAAYDAGEVPHFCNYKDSAAQNDPTWQCAALPKDLQDRRVEITGPVDRKMVINGLNSGATVYMADLEDSSSPTWTNMMEGQINLRDAIRGDITYTNPTNGKLYTLNEKTATLMVRPRGWHLDEAHLLVNGTVASGSLVDFALYLFHNHAALASKKTGPYYYLPKLESYQEAALWNDVFCAAQQYLGLAIGTIRATVLLETITAAFEMEEILYELRDHSLGLNCGRWDYLFSFIKKFKAHSDKIAPDRSFLSMTTPLMEAYVQRLIYICHKRGTFAMGGMSAAIPIKNNPEANAKAMQNVEDDKLREVQAGHDGTWVAHPALVTVALRVFDKHMPGPNQIASHPAPEGAKVTQEDLLRLPAIPHGTAITAAGLQKGITIVLAYTEAWLRGIGCIPLNNAMEDAATAEISRAQIWQWRSQGVATQEDGDQVISADRIVALVDQHVQQQCDQAAGAEGSKDHKWLLAGKVVKDMLNGDELDDFLTSVCYPYITSTADATPTQVPVAAKI